MTIAVCWKWVSVRRRPRRHRCPVGGGVALPTRPRSSSRSSCEPTTAPSRSSASGRPEPTLRSGTRSPPGRRRAVRIDAGPTHDSRERARSRIAAVVAGERLRHLRRLLVGSRHGFGSGVPRPRTRQSPRPSVSSRSTPSRPSTTGRTCACVRRLDGGRREVLDVGTAGRAVGRGFGAPPPPGPARRHGALEDRRHRGQSPTAVGDHVPPGHRDAVPAAGAHARPRRPVPVLSRVREILDVGGSDTRPSPRRSSSPR